MTRNLVKFVDLPLDLMNLSPYTITKINQDLP